MATVNSMAAFSRWFDPEAPKSYKAWYNRNLARKLTDINTAYTRSFNHDLFTVACSHTDVTYITSKQLNHARNSFEDEHWDITWLDEPGVDYNPNKIKFDFVGMQKKISMGINGNTGSDWKPVNLVTGERPW